MSSVGTILHSIISLKNNTLLRKGHTYMSLNAKLKRKIITQEDKIKTYKRSPEDLLELKYRYKKRYKSMMRKRIIFLSCIIFLGFLMLFWML